MPGWARPRPSWPPRSRAGWRRPRERMPQRTLPSGLTGAATRCRPGCATNSGAWSGSGRPRRNSRPKRGPPRPLSRTQAPRPTARCADAQAAVDATAQVIVAHHLTNNAADHDALRPLLDAATANTAATPAEVSADSGYCSEANLADLAERGIRGYVATGRAKHPDGGEDQRRGPLVSAMRLRLRRAGRRSRYRLRKQVV